MATCHCVAPRPNGALSSVWLRKNKNRFVSHWTPSKEKEKKAHLLSNQLLYSQYSLGQFCTRCALWMCWHTRPLGKLRLGCVAWSDPFRSNLQVMIRWETNAGVDSCTGFLPRWPCFLNSVFLWLLLKCFIQNSLWFIPELIFRL